MTELALKCWKLLFEHRLSAVEMNVTFSHKLHLTSSTSNNGEPSDLNNYNATIRQLSTAISGSRRGVNYIFALL